MFSFEPWMIPGVVIATAVGLVTAGFLWGVVLYIKQRMTNGAGDTDE